MNREQIMQLDANGIEQRRAQIRTEMEAPTADLNALTQEAGWLEERANELRHNAELRSQLLARIAGGSGSTIADLSDRGTQTEARTYDASSAEYRDAFLLHVAHRDAEMTEEQRTAFTHLTTNSAAVLPTEMLNEIWSLIEESHVIMGDIEIIRSGVTIEIPVHKSIKAGDAAVVNEGAANDDEENELIKVTLSGKDFSKDVDVSYRMARMAIPAFMSYIDREIAERIGAAMAADVVTNAITAKIATGNRVNTAAVKKLAYTDVTAAFAKLKRAGNVCVYGTRETVYTYLAGMVDTTGRPIFQINAQDRVEGVLLGGLVKIEEACAANTLLIGDPKRVVFNMIQDIMLESDKDIKKHVYTHSGYACGEGELIDSESFVLLTVKQA